MHAPHPATSQLGKYLYLSFTGLQLAPQKPLLFAEQHGLDDVAHFLS
jgi:hypothetical protein